jgi:hypothetical protein
MLGLSLLLLGGIGCHVPEVWERFGGVGRSGWHCRRHDGWTVL